MVEAIVKCDQCGETIAHAMIKKLLSDHSTSIELCDDTNIHIVNSYKKTSLYINDEFIGNLCRKCSDKLKETVKKNSPAKDPLEDL